MSSTARISKPVALQDPAIMRWSLIGLALGFIILVLFLPLISVFLEALRHGLGAYFAAVIEPDARAAILLTLEVAAIAVPLDVAANTKATSIFLLTIPVPRSASASLSKPRPCGQQEVFARFVRFVQQIHHLVKG